MQLTRTVYPSEYYTVVLSSIYSDMMLKFQDVVAFHTEDATNKCLAQMAVSSHWNVEEAYIQGYKEWVQ